MLKTFNFAKETNPVFICIKEKALKAGVGYRDPFSYPAGGLFGLGFDASGSTNIVMATHVLEARIALERAAFKVLKLGKAAYLLAAIGQIAWTDDQPTAINVVEAFPTATTTIANAATFKFFTDQPEKNVWYEELLRACRYLTGETPNNVFEHEVRYFVNGCVPFGRRIVTPQGGLDLSNIFDANGICRMRLSLVINNNSKNLGIRNVIFPRFTNPGVSDGPFVLKSIRTGALFRCLISYWDTVQIASPTRNIIFNNGNPPLTRSNFDTYNTPALNVGLIRNYLNDMTIPSSGLRYGIIPAQSVTTFTFSVMIADDRSLGGIADVIESGPVRIQLGEPFAAFATDLTTFDSTAGFSGFVDHFVLMPNDSGPAFTLSRACTGGIQPDPPPDGGEVVITNIVVNPIRTCPKDPVFTHVGVTLQNKSTFKATIRPSFLKYTWEMSSAPGVPGAPIPGVTVTGFSPKEAIVDPQGFAIFAFSVTLDVQTDPPAGSTGRAIIQVAFQIIGVTRRVNEEADFLIFGTKPASVLKGCDPNKDTPPKPPPPPDPPPPAPPDDTTPPGTGDTDDGGPPPHIFGFNIKKSIVSFVFKGEDGSGATANSNQIAPHDPTKPQFAAFPNAAQIVYTFYNPWSFPILARIDPQSSLNQNVPTAPLQAGLYLHDATGLDVTDQFTITAIGATEVTVPPFAGTVDENGNPDGPTGPTVTFNVILKDQPLKPMSILVVDAIAHGTVMAPGSDGGNPDGAAELATWGTLAYKTGDTVSNDPGPYGGGVLEAAELEVVYKTPGYEGGGTIIITNSSANPAQNVANNKMDPVDFLKFTITYTVQNLKTVPVRLLTAAPTLIDATKGNLDVNFTYTVQGLPVTIPASSTVALNVLATSRSNLYQQLFTAVLQGAAAAQALAGIAPPVEWAAPVQTPGLFRSLGSPPPVPRQSPGAHIAVGIQGGADIVFTSLADFTARTSPVAGQPGVRSFNAGSITITATSYLPNSPFVQLRLNAGPSPNIGMNITFFGEAASAKISPGQTRTFTGNLTINFTSGSAFSSPTFIEDNGGTSPPHKLTGAASFVGDDIDASFVNVKISKVPLF